MPYKSYILQRLKAKTSNRLPAFTLIELLVVISIIALLMSIMLPSLNRARGAARRTHCASSQRNIFTAIMLYQHDFDGKLFEIASNYSRWYDLGEDSGNTGEVLSPNDQYAYWGLAYVPYGAERDLFKCPDKRTNYHHTRAADPEDMKAFDYSDYGLNMFLCWRQPTEPYEMASRGESRFRLHQFTRPSQTIVLSDHWEPTLEGNGDGYYIRRGDDINLTQWRDSANAYRECWRHNNSSNILWLDGHISNLRETTGEDVRYVWYTGGVGGLTDD